MFADIVFIVFVILHNSIVRLKISTADNGQLILLFTCCFAISTSPCCIISRLSISEQESQLLSTGKDGRVEEIQDLPAKGVDINCRDKVRRVCVCMYVCMKACICFTTTAVSYSRLCLEWTSTYRHLCSYKISNL